MRIGIPKSSPIKDEIGGTVLAASVDRGGNDPAWIGGIALKGRIRIEGELIALAHTTCLSSGRPCSTGIGGEEGRARRGDLDRSTRDHLFAIGLRRDHHYLRLSHCEIRGEQVVDLIGRDKEERGRCLIDQHLGREQTRREGKAGGRRDSRCQLGAKCCDDRSWCEG